MYKIIVSTNGERIDITNYTGQIELSTNLGTLGASFNFEIARNKKDPNFIDSEKVIEGSLVKFKNSKEVFSGIVVEVEERKFSKSIKCLDYYFYLNNNKLIKQFYNINASSAIEKLLQDVKAPIGNIEFIATSITKIYKNNTIAEIIDDILNQVNDELGVKYILEIENCKFNLQKYKKIHVQARENILGVPTVTRSISNMKNSVKVISNEQEVIHIFAEARDEVNIKKYGRLQEVIEVDPDKDDISKIRNIANTKLKELNKVTTNASLDIFGHDDIRAGRIIEIDIPEFNLLGNYLIKSCSHKFIKGHHICSIEVEVV